MGLSSLLVFHGQPNTELFGRGFVNQQAIGFFEQLVGLETTAQGLALYDQINTNPLPFQAPELPRKLYENLITHLLTRQGHPPSHGSAYREWRPLYRLWDDLNPAYYSPGSISQALDKCPPLPIETQTILEKTLSAFFKLMAEGFPKSFPSPLLDRESTLAWADLFPTDEQWKALTPLEQTGLVPLVNWAGYRAAHRYENGVDTPPHSPATLRSWCQRLEEGISTRSDQGIIRLHQLSLLANGFAGNHTQQGLEGPCSEIPQCYACPIQPTCAFGTAPADSVSTPEALVSQIGLGRLEKIPTGRLIQTILGLSRENGDILEEIFAKASLREATTWTTADVRSRFQGKDFPREGLQALLEMFRRFEQERLAPGMPIKSAADVYRIFGMRLRDLKQEQIHAILLDTRRCFLDDVLITQGTLNFSPMHPREVFAAAVRERAASVIIIHNHPSGDPSPSKEDLEVTQQLVEAGGVVGIPVFDHVIIAGERFFSLREKGLL